jgi:hypothetical protein
MDDPQIQQIVFDPHVASAMICILFSIVGLVLLSLWNIESK